MHYMTPMMQLTMTPSISLIMGLLIMLLERPFNFVAKQIKHTMKLMESPSIAMSWAIILSYQIGLTVLYILTT